MKKFLLSVAAVAALGAAVTPAAAQDYGRWRDHDRYDRDYGGWANGQGDRLERRIERAMETGQISRREGWRLRSNLERVFHLERRYRDDGRLSGWERNDLDRRYDQIAMQLRYERRDRDYGWYR